MVLCVLASFFSTGNGPRASWKKGKGRTIDATLSARWASHKVVRSDTHVLRRMCWVPTWLCYATTTAKLCLRGSVAQKGISEVHYESNRSKSKNFWEPGEALLENRTGASDLPTVCRLLTILSSKSNWFSRVKLLVPYLSPSLEIPEPHPCFPTLAQYKRAHPCPDTHTVHPRYDFAFMERALPWIQSGLSL